MSAKIQDSKARKNIGPYAMQVFFELHKKWHLSRTEAMCLLGVTSTSTYANWKNGLTAKISRDTIERISYIIEIERYLKAFALIHLTPAENLLRHLILANQNCSPLDIMLKGNVVDLFKTKDILASQIVSNEKQSDIPAFSD